MDVREGIALYGSPYYFNRGVSGPGSSGVRSDGGGGGSGGGGGGSSGSGNGSGGGGRRPMGMPTPSGFKPLSNPNIAVQSNVGGGGAVSSAFQVENPSTNFARNIDIGMTSNATPGDPVKKKRGRPRKYGPDGSNMSLALSSMSSRPSPGSLTPGPKRSKGRPRGTGWKQQLAPLGDWMNSSAGLAFTPHVIHIGIGEDVAAKILAFAEQRPRALCILSANGTVSAVTLRPPASSGATVTYEGRFDILRMSGSYLVAESGGPRNRIGGLSISVSSPDGHVLGGAIGGQLMAASSVQVVACSFVHGNTNAKNKTENSARDDMDSAIRSAEKSQTPVITTPIQNRAPNMAVWPSSSSRTDMRSSQKDIDLTRG
ncbi:AT-hook motif nuclear-localized protein 5-like isoform X1 [Ipomoea triloba]|uniref:AT-hook motif nuclear-localized protein 5-like isoform X1 n=1 Tax=Ipomoea triloba TaxID=35885 RepID=UPI00125D4DE9|nr:AT-hook motif nuclear-localized protein 5-like isoform X1 [Ipomoea triloba]GMC85198.1 AT-hook motif nuclear-localized protein 5-like [Ipomoea batatas]